MVDRQLKLDILDVLRRKKFQNIKEIAAAKGCTVDQAKEAITELIAEKQVFYFSQ